MVTKREFRKEALARRARFTGEQRELAANALARQLLSLEVLKQAHTVSAYVPFGGEINVLVALKALLASPDHAVNCVAMPRVADNETLTLHTTDPALFLEPFGARTVSFVEGYGGILEPAPDWPELPFSAVDVIIVPGVAFDRSCMRIGYGKGFYDRMLHQRKAGCPAIGAIYDELLYDELPLETHDVPMDMIATPSGIITRA